MRLVFAKDVPCFGDELDEEGIFMFLSSSVGNGSARPIFFETVEIFEEKKMYSLFIFSGY